MALGSRSGSNRLRLHGGPADGQIASLSHLSQLEEIFVTFRELIFKKARKRGSDGAKMSLVQTRPLSRERENRVVSLPTFMGKLFLHSLRREALGARKGAKTQRKKRRNSFHLILLGVFAPSRGPTKASLYPGHGADLLTRPPDFQLLTKKIPSSCEKRAEGVF